MTVEQRGPMVSWRRVVPVVGVLVLIAAVILVVAALVGGGSSGGGGSTPISQQSCAQLAATLRQIQHDEGPGQSFDTQSSATKRADELNTRVDALGGCPSEPSLQ